MTLLARTNPDSTGYDGLSMFLRRSRGNRCRPVSAPGMKGGEIHVLGRTWQREIGFDDFETDGDGLLGGEEGQGFALMRTFSAHSNRGARGWRRVQRVRSRVRLSEERRVFASQLIGFPRVADKLALMLTGRCWRASSAISRRVKDTQRRSDIEAGMAKLLGARCVSNADTALQIHGGNGYSLEYPISRCCATRAFSTFSKGCRDSGARIYRRFAVTTKPMTEQPRMHQRLPAATYRAPPARRIATSTGCVKPIRTFPATPIRLRIADLSRNARAARVERVVIVQPLYGFDNRATLDAIAQMGTDRARCRHAGPTRRYRSWSVSTRGLALRFFAGRPGVRADAGRSRACADLASTWSQGRDEWLTDALPIPTCRPVVIDHLARTPPPPASATKACNRALLGGQWALLAKISAPYLSSRAGALATTTARARPGAGGGSAGPLMWEEQLAASQQLLDASPMRPIASTSIGCRMRHATTILCQPGRAGFSDRAAPPDRGARGGPSR